MELLAFLIAVFVVLASLLVFSRRRAASERSRPVAYERRHLFAKSERAFLDVLDQATGGQIRVFGKVRLDALIQVPSAVVGDPRRVARNRIVRERVGFVLCDRADLRVLAVVELDDAREAGDRGEERDVFVDAALASAEIPLIRFAARTAVDEVRRQLDPVVRAVQTAAPSGRRPKAASGKAGRTRDRAQGPAAASVPALGTVPDTASETASVSVSNAAPVAAPAAATVATRPQAADGERDPYARLGSCPSCGRPMVERVGKRGALKGKQYLVCSGDPPCDPVVANG